jgi:hypothetical protein
MNKINFINEKHKLFCWLYSPFNIISESNPDQTITYILKLGKKYKIEHTIIIYKIVDYLFSKKSDNHQIINYLYKFNLISDDYENINKMHTIIDSIKSHHSPRKISDDIIKKLYSLSQTHSYSPENKTIHQGYPLPHPIYGRPRLDWCECFYEECHKKTNDANELKQHLEKFNLHTYGLHLYHERACISLHLTPEKIMDKGIKHCPSIVCDKAKHTFTPEELCEHFKILGISPFWTPGTIITNKTTEKCNLTKLYVGDECVICNEDNIKPSIIFEPCHHATLCIECYSSINKCPICRSEIRNSIPI